jgi:periplasmic copper chaperone A
MAAMKSGLLLAAIALACTPFAALAQVSVSDAWVRGTVQGQKATGAFMQITSATDASLVAVTSPVAKVAEIHTMSHEGGVMKMRRIEAISLPAGKPVELGPGGYHVMLMDVGQPLKEGDKVPLTLTFADKAGNRTTQAVSATVRPLASPAHKH